MITVSENDNCHYTGNCHCTSTQFLVRGTTLTQILFYYSLMNLAYNLVALLTSLLQTERTNVLQGHMRGGGVGANHGESI